MTHVPESPIDQPNVQGLAIPADPTKPVTVVDLNDETGDSTASLQRLVGGHLEIQAHDEGDIWLNELGRLIDLPFNARANFSTLNVSVAGRHGLVGEPTLLYGDVVMTGPPDLAGDATSVDPNLVDYFQSLHLHADALKDWDIQSIEVIVLDWTDDVWPDPGL